jgi:hypothetical protein
MLGELTCLNGHNGLILQFTNYRHENLKAITDVITSALKLSYTGWTNKLMKFGNKMKLKYYLAHKGEVAISRL